MNSSEKKRFTFERRKLTIDPVPTIYYYKDYYYKDSNVDNDDATVLLLI